MKVVGEPKAAPLEVLAQVGDFARAEDHLFGFHGIDQRKVKDSSARRFDDKWWPHIDSGESPEQLCQMPVHRRIIRVPILDVVGYPAGITHTGKLELGCRRCEDRKSTRLNSSHVA